MRKEVGKEREKALTERNAGGRRVHGVRDGADLRRGSF
jgi:hypothetical protein